jgi:predicted SAM-dependent methyltransferase
LWSGIENIIELSKNFYLVDKNNNQFMKNINYFFISAKEFLAKKIKMLKVFFLSKRNLIKIIIGAGETSQKGWISTEIDQLNLLKEKNWARFFPKKNISAILSEHVWEHLTKEEGMMAARMCFKYLSSGGYLRVAVPDGFHCNKEYIEYVKPNGNGPGAEDHKILYNFQTFKEIFESVGFSVDLLEYFDENGKFIHKEWNPEQGMITRSKKFDQRNCDGKLNYTSIILDAKK